MAVRLDWVQVFLVPNQFPTEQGFHRRPAVAHFTLVGSFIIVINEPIVQVFLQGADIRIQFFTESHLIKLLQNRLVEAFADAVGLGRHGLCPGVVDVIDGQVELVIVLIHLAAILGATVREDAQHRQALAGIKRQHPVVQQISGGDRRFCGVQLAMHDFAVSVDKRLLVNAPHTFEIADVERVLRTEIARVGGLDLAAGHVVLVLSLQCRNLFVAQDNAFVGDLGLKRT